MIVRIFVLLILFFSAGVFAQQKPASEGPSVSLPPIEGCTAIPDDAYDGTVASMACITIAGPAGEILDMSASVSMEHTWVGDLTYKIVAPDNTVLTLMSLPGLAETGDDGSDCCGDSSNLQISDTLTFVNGGATSAEDMGSTISGAQFACGDDGLCEYAPAPDTGPGTDFSDFIGMEASGTWQFCVGDSAAGDTGNLCGASINFVTPPPVIPTTNFYGLVMLLLATLAASFVIFRKKFS